MSGISSIGSGGNSLSLILQRLDGANSQSGGLSVSGDSDDSPLSAMRSKLEASGVDVQKLDSLQDKIKSAVTSAIQNAAEFRRNDRHAAGDPGCRGQDAQRQRN